MIDSLNDVINSLKLDVYKRITMQELTELTIKEIDPMLYNKVNKEVTEVVSQIPPKTYRAQPQGKKFFLPPIEDLLSELNTSLEEETEGRETEERKLFEEEVINFACADNLLVILSKCKDGTRVFYSYNYDYVTTHSLILMSRVEYRGNL